MGEYFYLKVTVKELNIFEIFLLVYCQQENISLLSENYDGKFITSEFLSNVDHKTTTNNDIDMNNYE